MYVYFVLGFSLKYMMYVYFVLGNHDITRDAIFGK